MDNVDLSPVCLSFFFVVVCEQIPIFGRFSDNLRENMRDPGDREEIWRCI